MGTTAQSSSLLSITVVSVSFKEVTNGQPASKGDGGGKGGGGDGGMNTGIIAGAAVGGVVLLVGIAAVVWWWNKPKVLKGGYNV